MKITKAKCKDCNILYSDMGVDLIIADQDWRRLTENEDRDIILCANCICKRADKIGKISILAWLR